MQERASFALPGQMDILIIQGAGGERLPVGMGTQNGVLVGEATQGVEQRGELAGGEQDIQPVEAARDVLPYLAVDALVVNDQRKCGCRWYLQPAKPSQPAGTEV